MGGGEEDMYLGYQLATRQEGLLGYDLANIVGLPFYKDTRDGAPPGWMAGDRVELWPVVEEMTCLVYKPGTDQATAGDVAVAIEKSTECGTSMTTVCKRKLVEGFGNFKLLGEGRVEFASDVTGVRAAPVCIFIVILTVI